MGTFFAYATLAAYFLASGLCLAFFLAQRDSFCRGGAWMMGLGFITHTLGLGANIASQGLLTVVTFAGALSVFAWALVAAFLVLYWRHPIMVLGALVAPLAALALAGSLILPGGEATVSPALRSFWVYLHILLAFLGVAAFSLAGLGGIFYLIQERQIKGKKFGFFYRRLPSLEQLDALNYWCLSLGFPLLTGAIITGSLYAQLTLGRLWSWDPKEIFTLTAWLIYAVLLHERLAVGWRGRRAALLAICGFLVLILTFVGANLWLSSYHSFAAFTGRP
ncbi:MAG: cytochrome c biogenesis protein CcsA [Deltaproteobacteria bacterium]|nr:cytochrome c biogenesis protein CcsA [Deltaproteobacteria bacterium]